MKEARVTALSIHPSSLPTGVRGRSVEHAREAAGETAARVPEVAQPPEAELAQPGVHCRRRERI